MNGLKTIFTVTDQNNPGDGVAPAKIDKDFLKDKIDPKRGKYYICGPEPMIDDIAKALSDLGVDDDRIVTEDLD